MPDPPLRNHLRTELRREDDSQSSYGRNIQNGWKDGGWLYGPIRHGHGYPALNPFPWSELSSEGFHVRRRLRAAVRIR